MIQSLKSVSSGLIVDLCHGLDCIFASPPNQRVGIAIGCFKINSIFGEFVVMGMKCPPKYQKVMRQSDSETAVYSKIRKLAKSCYWKLWIPICAMVSGDKNERVSLMTRI